jgi:hypothetical protein
MRHLYRLLLVTATALACAFAPAPPPKTGVAEAVLNAYGGGPDQVRHTLETMLPATLQGEKVRGLACLKGEKAPSEWVWTRLRVEEVAPKGPVRVRLEGGRPNETLALLTALVNTYEAGRRASREEALYARQLQPAVAQVGGNALPLRARGLRRPAGPAVIQRPKLISGASR